MQNGLGASKGIGIGRAVIISSDEPTYKEKKSNDPDGELKRFDNALKKYFDENEATAQKVRNSLGEKEAQIILGHSMIMNDPAVKNEIEYMIKQGLTADYSVDKVCSSFVDILQSSDDELTRERASDVIDVKTGMLQILLGKKNDDILSIPQNSVLVCRELTPSMTARMNKQNVCGIITEEGGITSHCAIMARAFEIPAVLGAKGIINELSDGENVIVDGTSGKIIISPDDDEIKKYKNLKQNIAENKSALKKYINKKTIDKDNNVYALMCNIGGTDEAEQVTKYGGEGVGLFRTEFLFMDRNSIPTEEEQFTVYKDIAQKLSPSTITIRTLDIGGDKAIEYLGLKKEENPYLGFRAIRFCLKRDDIFIPQLRAILRASAYGKIRILLPLVTTVDEIIAAKKIINDIKDELKQKSVAFDESIDIGVMIETPSSAVISDILAKNVDFFSIGTNDLTQYTMAVDRGNQNVSSLYSVFEPSVLRLIKKVIINAKSHNIEVGMCGEEAANPLLIPLLISYGLDEFSVTPSNVPETRKEISRWSKALANKISYSIEGLKNRTEIVGALMKYVDKQNEQ